MSVAVTALVSRHVAVARYRTGGRAATDVLPGPVQPLRPINRCGPVQPRPDRRVRTCPACIHFCPGCRFRQQQRGRRSDASSLTRSQQPHVPASRSSSILADVGVHTAVDACDGNPFSVARRDPHLRARPQRDAGEILVAIGCVLLVATTRTRRPSFMTATRARTSPRPAIACGTRLIGSREHSGQFALFASGVEPGYRTSPTRPLFIIPITNLPYPKNPFQKGEARRSPRY